MSIQVGQRSGFVCVEISDSGEGIPCELRDRVFEPFYTTKAPHRCTGLGLSISRRIVNQHGGRIWLSDTQGIGTKVTVELPASTDAC